MSLLALVLDVIIVSTDVPVKKLFHNSPYLKLLIMNHFPCDISLAGFDEQHKNS